MDVAVAGGNELVVLGAFGCGIFDKNPEVAKKLSIDTIPTLCIYKDGKLIEKKVGYMPKEKIIDFIEKYQ